MSDDGNLQDCVLKENVRVPFPVKIRGGEVLRIRNITREDMGFYMCIAKNGVPPAVSKTMKISVNCEYIDPFHKC